MRLLNTTALVTTAFFTLPCFGQTVGMGSPIPCDCPVDYLNVLDYGADPEDNTNDDTAAIQAAIEDLRGTGAVPAGGTIYFPAGTYNISESGATGYGLLIEDIKNIRFLGASRQASVLQFDSTGSSVYAGLVVAEGSSDFVAEHISFKTSDPTVSNTVDGIYFSPADEPGIIPTPATRRPVRPTIRHCRFDGFNIAILNEAGGNMNLADSFFLRSWTSSIVMGGGIGTDANQNSITVNVSESSIQRTRFSANIDPISEQEVMSGPQIRITSAGGIRMLMCDITGGTQNLFVANSCTQCPNTPIPTNVWCQSVIFGGLTGGANGNPSVFLGSGVQNTMFNDCIFEGASSHGLQISDGARNIDINGGMIRDNEKDGVNISNPDGHVSIKNVRIAGNNGANGNNDGVRITNLEDQNNAVVIISDCHIGSRFNPSMRQVRSCINLNGTGTGGKVVLSNNQFSGYDSTSPIMDNSPASVTVTTSGNIDLGP